MAARKGHWPKTNGQEEQLQELTHTVVTLLSPMENNWSTTKETENSEFSPVQCLVACHTRTNRNDVSPAPCAFSFPSTFPDLQQMRKSGYVCSSGALFGTFCTTWCLLLSGKYWGTGWANIIRPPARPASGLFQRKLGVPEDFPSGSPAGILQGCWEFIPEKIQQLPISDGPGCALWPHGFSGQGKESSSTLHKPLTQAHALLFAGGLGQGKDFPGIACGPTAAPPAARGFLQGMNSWFSWLQCAAVAANHDETHREGSCYRVLQVNSSRKQLDVLLHPPENFRTAFLHNHLSIPAFLLILPNVSSTSNFFDSFLVCSSGTLSLNIWDLRPNRKAGFG